VAFALVLLVLAVWNARTRQGWAYAVVFAVMVHPRLLVYQLLSLLANFGGPDQPEDPSP